MSFNPIKKENKKHKKTKKKKTDSFLYLQTYALKLTNEGANLYFDHVCSRSRPLHFDFSWSILI